MAHFHQIPVQVYKETSDCTVITFDVPTELQEEFQYSQGQHLTLRTFIDGEDIRRSYSLCSSPVDKEWKVAVKQIPGGAFSSYANTDLKSGDVLDIFRNNKQLYGLTITALHEGKENQYICIYENAGWGEYPIITDVVCMRKTETRRVRK